MFKVIDNIANLGDFVLFSIAPYIEIFYTLNYLNHDQGYEFADDEYDEAEAEEIAQAQKDESKARAEAEKKEQKGHSELRMNIIY